MDFASWIALCNASNAPGGTGHSPSPPSNGVRRVLSFSRLNEVDGGNLRGENVGSLLSGEGNLQERSRFEGDLGVGCMELDDSLGTSEQSGGEDSSSFWKTNAGKKQRSNVMEDHSTCPSDTKNGRKQTKRKGRGDKNGDVRVEAETNPGVNSNPVEQMQAVESPKQDYIHVRARRGEAMDSHSLAERARREKISERMKILQDLVPGCNKVIGKAMVLDEIINYIQALQHQVEFLSMKLEAVDSRMNSQIEAFQAKDLGLQGFEPAGVAFSSLTARDSGSGSPQEWLHMQVGGGFERGT